MASLSSRLNNSSLAVNAFSIFNVNIKSMTGDMTRIKCHSDMRISTLIDKLLETLPEDKKDLLMDATLLLPVLNKNGEVTGYKPLHPNDLLGDKGIVDNTVLDVVYHDIYSKMSCIHPFPNGETLSQNLHRWIEAQEPAGRIDFNPPFEPEAVVRQRMEEAYAQQMGPNAPPLLHPPTLTNGMYTSRRNTTLLLNHNNWNWDKDTVFTLTNSQTLEDIGIPVNQTFVSPIMNANVLYKADEPFRKIRYNTGIQNAVSTGDFEVPEHSTIRGKVYGIYIIINQIYQRATGWRQESYERQFHIVVQLSGPITIRNKNGDKILHSFTSENAICEVPYEMILRCDAGGNLHNSMNELQAPNLEAPNSGGRRHRIKKSKQTKKSKRTKNKRKTRSR